MKKQEKNNLLEKITALSKRRGLLYPNSEIYGGFAGFYDYGPIGVEMKNNLKKLWWDYMVTSRADVVGIDGTIITHPMVWEASGHIKNFNDEMVECKKCHKRFRVDKLDDDKCPECKGEVTNSRKYNLMMETEVGVVQGEKTKTYLRGEACQNIYLDYENVLNSTRMKIPFGIAQIGKAFRNEVTPGRIFGRAREFEQYDLQYFVNPKEAKKWYEYWKEERIKFYKTIYRNKENIRLRKHADDELAFYAKVAYDIEFNSPWGWEENEGIHWRGDYDLTQHGKFAHKDFTYTDPNTGEKYIPYIVETSGGVDRTFLFALFDAYEEEQLENGNERVVLKLNPLLAAYKAAVFPLVANKEKLVEISQEIFDNLSRKFSVTLDTRGNIGKRYRYQDEIGTPYCITVDYETLEDNTVTIRDRDTMKQERVKIEQLDDIITKKLSEQLDKLYAKN
ncbi:MAG: glycine--tRNA ligase [bacterium]